MTHGEVGGRFESIHPQDRDFPGAQAGLMDRVDDHGAPVAFHQVEKGESGELRFLDVDAVRGEKKLSCSSGRMDADTVIAQDRISQPQNKTASLFLPFYRLRPDFDLRHIRFRSQRCHWQ